MWVCVVWVGAGACDDKSAVIMNRIVRKIVFLFMLVLGWKGLKV